MISTNKREERTNLVDLEENLSLLFRPKHFPLLLPRLFDFLVPGIEPVKCHPHGGLLYLVFVGDITIFMAIASESVGKSTISPLTMSKRDVPSDMSSVYVGGISTRVMRRRNDNLDLPPRRQ